MGKNKQIPNYVPNIYELVELSTSGEDGRNRVVHEPVVVRADKMARSRQRDAMSCSPVPLEGLDFDPDARSIRTAQVDVIDEAFPHVNWKPIIDSLIPKEREIVLRKIGDPRTTLVELAK